MNKEKLIKLRNSVNEFTLNESSMGLISSNSTPELLEEAYFVGNTAKIIDKNVSAGALDVIMESEGLVGTKDYSYNNTVVSGTLEEAISYFTNMSESNKIIGFKW